MRILFLALATSFLSSSASAFLVDLPYTGGYVPTLSSGGDTVNLLAPPVSLSSTSLEADVLANRLIQRFGYTVSRGTGISGTLTVDTYQAQLAVSNPFNFFGSIIDMRLNTADDISTTRWILDRDVFFNGSHVSDDVVSLGNGLAGPEPPFYYNSSSEGSNRNGSNSFGSFSMHLRYNATSRFQTAVPHTEGDHNYAFLVTVNGGGSFTIREGVRFGHDAQVAPEPASILGIGIGALLLIRRRRRSQ